VPLQIQLIEPDHLDRLKLKNGGNRVVAGIELDALNKRQAYWLYPEHPGDVGLGLTASLRNGAVRVPADQVAHLYRRSRPGQLTGVPWLAPVMLDLRDLGDYEQAEAVRKKIEACFAAFVTTQDSDDPRTLGAESTDDDGRLETIEPGLIEYLEQGEDIKFAQPTSNGSYGEYTRQRLHKIATGLDMPYIVLTGDVSQTNYSSYRAGLIQFQRAVRQFQRQVLIPGFCRPVWSWFIESAFAAGRIGEMNTRVKWTLPQFESVDRQKEALADLIEVRMGKTPMPEIIRRSGGDPGRVLAEIEKWLTLIDAKGLVLDSDPRKVTRAGVSQFSDPRLLDGEPDTDAVTTE
jgi:lambda family phage portal protein